MITQTKIMIDKAKQKRGDKELPEHCTAEFLEAAHQLWKFAHNTPEAKKILVDDLRRLIKKRDKITLRYSTFLEQHADGVHIDDLKKWSLKIANNENDINLLTYTLNIKP